MRWARSRQQAVLVARPVGPRALPPSDPDLTVRLRREYETTVQKLAPVAAAAGAGVVVGGDAVVAGPAVPDDVSFTVASRPRTVPLLDTPGQWPDTRPT